MADVTIARDRWCKVKQCLQRELSEDVFNNCFAKLELESDLNGLIQLSVPTRFLKNWLKSRYHDLLLAVCRKEFANVNQIEFLIRTAVQANLSPHVDSAAGGVDRLNSDTVVSEETTGQLRGGRTYTNSRSSFISNVGLIGSPLDTRYSFSSFVEGSSNSMALAASKCVAARQSQQSMGSNLLFVHAPVGLGKTHLLQSITAETAASGRKAIYFTAEHFMFSFISALSNRTALSFKKQLRSIDMLLVDDLQFLHGQRVKQEFCHILNCLIDGAGQIVVAADRTVADLASLGERVRSRLSGGVMVEITLPNLDLRRRTVQGITKSRLEMLPAHRRSLSMLSEDVIDFIAHNISSNGRDLDGAVIRMIAHTQLSNAPITLPIAEAILRDLMRNTHESKWIKIEDIQQIVCDEYNVSKSELISGRRTKVVVKARQVAMYLSKKLTSRSLPEIGKNFGNRDHTTVLYSVRKIDELINTDHNVASEVNAIRRHLVSC